MHAVAWGALRTARQNVACRIVAGVRRPLPSRNFHRSAVAYRIPDDAAREAAEALVAESNEESVPVENGAGSAAESSIEAVETQQKPRARAGYGSAVRRAARNRQPKELPAVLLPDWFWDRNIQCHEDVRKAAETLGLCGERNLTRSQSPKNGGTPSDLLSKKDVKEFVPQLVESPQNNGTEDSQIATPVVEADSEINDQNPVDTDPNSDARLPKPLNTNSHMIDINVYSEIIASIQAGLLLRPPPDADITSVPRPDLLLQCPRTDAASLLDAVVNKTAADLSADVIRLGPEEFATIIGDYVGDNIAWSLSPLASLGYETSRVGGALEAYDDDPVEMEDQDEIDDDEGSARSMKAFTSAFKLPTSTTRPKGIAILASPFGSSMGGSSRHDSLPDIMDLNQMFSRSGPPARSPASTEPWADYKIVAALEALIGSADAKRSHAGKPADSKVTFSANPNNSKDSPPLIIQISEYKELSKTKVGGDILKKLRDIVKRQWHQGKMVVIVGTTTAEDNVPALQRGAIQRLQFDMVLGDHQTIFVPPQRTDSQDSTFITDEKLRIRELNIRHVEDMILKLSEPHYSMSIDLKKDLSSNTGYGDINEHVWSYPRVHRLASVMLGCRTSDVLEGPAFAEALETLHASDEEKFSWGKAEMEERDTYDPVEEDAYISTPATTKKLSDDRLKQIKKTCTAHEKKLFGGVINPADIHTTFADVRAPPETIEALKTLTSLSLVRPEAFSYGVLATDKIPGLLLYGPPGTGKTLLAKAVAKESGATVLEVSGSELNDMYVGEGEKNVKALFSLAKKLSPCVVFIDEADAIFAARGESSSKRTSHRELINQFLREWDGMNDLSAFIMVATNRPFDLDEAVLRRLPRRLLVDLPVEKDREAILAIHLKDEILESSVSLAALAKDTPFYSGSDLKNLSVAAALACVREENDHATAYIGEEPYIFPPKRVLTKVHFEKAMEEISASISEDMSTLAAIRKFDERYGDRKGRKKRASALGFGGTTVVEVDSEAGRVRKMELKADV